MKFTFKINRHRASPLYLLVWWALLWKPNVIKRRVIFTKDSKYMLDSGDQEDRIKLFGFRFGFKKTSPSARFTYWYNYYTNKWELNYYVRYEGQEPIFDLVYTASQDEPYDLYIYNHNHSYRFAIYNSSGKLCKSVMVLKMHKRRFAILLGPYFGGNRTPEQKNSIQLSKF